jgi:hypothetical protein
MPTTVLRHLFEHLNQLQSLTHEIVQLEIHFFVSQHTLVGPKTAQIKFKISSPKIVCVASRFSTGNPLFFRSLQFPPVERALSGARNMPAHLCCAPSTL